MEEQAVPVLRHEKNDSRDEKGSIMEGKSSLFQERKDCHQRSFFSKMYQPSLCYRERERERDDFIAWESRQEWRWRARGIKLTIHTLVDISYQLNWRTDWTQLRPLLSWVWVFISISISCLKLTSYSRSVVVVFLTKRELRMQSKQNPLLFEKKNGREDIDSWMTWNCKGQNGKILRVPF